MRQNKRIKSVVCALAMIFGLSFANLPKTFADSSYFDVIGSDLNLDVLLPGENPELKVTIIAKKEMKLYGMEMHFTPTHPNDPEKPSDEDLRLISLDKKHSQMDGYAFSFYDGNLIWNMDGSDHTYDDRDYVDVEPGDILFEATYLLESGATSLKRSFSVTIDTAYIGDENGITKTLEGITFPANLYVTSGSNTDIITFYKHVEGNGVVLAPNIVADGDNLHIEVIPDEGYEVRYAQIDGYYFDEELVDNAFDMIVHSDGTSYHNIYVSFWPVYEVVEGDGDEYIVGSGEDLSFKINADLENFDGQGIVGVDDQWLAVDDEWTVDSDAKTVSLKSDFLATLELGEHSIELIFFYPEMGIARANFAIVEQSSDSDEEEIIPVPNTGIFTNSDSGAHVAVEPIIITAIFMVIGVLYIKKRSIKK